MVAFLDKIGVPREPPIDPSHERAYATSNERRIWKGVEGQLVADLLGNLLFPEEAREVNAGRLRSYVRAQLGIGELTDWTVVILAGSGESLDVNGWLFRTINREPLPRGGDSGRYIVKTILSPRDEAIDLDQSEFERALAETNRKRALDEKSPTGTPDGPAIRKVRGENRNGPYS